MREILDELPVSAPLASELQRVLARPRWSLAPSGRVTWPPYVFATCQALGGDTDLATWPAAAVELAIAAIDVADDLIDGEDPELTRWQRARLTNAATALAFMSQACIARMMQQVAPDHAAAVVRMLAAGTLGSTVGQDLDVILESQPSASMQQALETTERKSGSLGGMACAVGAALATLDQRTLELVHAFGSHAGTSAQLLNDMDGVDLGSAKSDLRLRKKTLPVAYLLAEAQRRTGATALSRRVGEWYRDVLTPCTPEVEEELQRLLHDTGALQFAWIVADARHRDAQSALHALALYTGRPQVSELRHLLASVKARRAA